jgi:hypothetical protein
MFFYYTVPESMPVKAQIVVGGTEKRDYRNSGGGLSEVEYGGYKTVEISLICYN